MTINMHLSNLYSAIFVLLPEEQAVSELYVGN